MACNMLKNWQDSQVFGNQVSQSIANVRDATVSSLDQHLIFKYLGQIYSPLVLFILEKQSKYEKYLITDKYAVSKIYRNREITYTLTGGRDIITSICKSSSSFEFHTCNDDCK